MFRHFLLIGQVLYGLLHGIKRVLQMIQVEKWFHVILKVVVHVDWFKI